MGLSIQRYFHFSGGLTMKIRSLALVGLAIFFALPTIPQHTTPPDQKLREQMLAFVTKYDPPFNNGDAAALAPFYTDDAVLVVPEGPVYGRGPLGNSSRD